MGFNPGLAPGQTISNEELVKIFNVNPQKGMRKSIPNNILVLVTDRVHSSYYKDREVDGIYHYTGMGPGNQRLDYAQNRTLAESSSTNIPVFYFEKFKKNNYVYIGEVELAGEPFTEVQEDEFKKPRTVYIFPLRLKEGQKEPVIPEELYREIDEQAWKRAEKLSPEEILEKAKNANGKPGYHTTSSKTYIRNPYVSLYAKNRANGVCELCKSQAPFNDKKKKPYLETHHVIWLSKDGDDTIDNTVALCPNCHKKMHILDLESDKELLLDKIRLRP